jgi:hypothetical protein
LDVDNLKLEDYSNIVNALKDGPSVPATVSFEVRWHGVHDRFKVTDGTNGFAARFIDNTATIKWSAEESGFKFVSDPANTSTSLVSLIGRERNGVFFSHDDTNDLDEQDDSAN